MVKLGSKDIRAQFRPRQLAVREVVLMELLDDLIMCQHFHEG